MGCEAPKQVRNTKGLMVTTVCRECDQCRWTRTNDFVGRAVAEHMTSGQTMAVTLTYGGGEHAAAKQLVYEHVQWFLKSLRERYKVRYLIAGEYGSKNGRAHWHCILFFQGNKWPYWETYKNIHTDHWPHGHIFVEKPKVEAFHYILKYIQKEKTGVSVRNFQMSKKPPLGDNYFRMWAAQHVAAGIAPQTFRYETIFEGERKKYYMQGKTRQNFLDYFITLWEVAERGPIPLSEIVEKRLDQLYVEANKGKVLLRQMMQLRHRNLTYSWFVQQVAGYVFEVTDMVEGVGVSVTNKQLSQIFAEGMAYVKSQ